LGFALGCIRLSYNDFCNATPEEYASICEAYSEQREAEYKDGWERARMIATVLIQPHTRKKVTAHNVCPFPWDKESKRKAAYKPVSPEEAKARFEALLKREQH
jgi:hypothetical protein